MDFSQERFMAFVKEHALVLCLGVAGVICLGYGLISLSGSKSAGDGMQFEAGAKDAAVEGSSVKNDVSQKSGKQITIDIEGAVQKPGVYQLSQGGRVQDALIAAGGMSSNADRQKVAQSVNLAAPLVDSAKLYIPFLGEQIVTSGTSSVNGSTTAGSESKQININQASASELDVLSGVGAVTAQKIISGRPYQNIQELVSKKAVGASLFEKIKDKISVY